MPLDFTKQVDEAEWDKYQDYLEKLWAEALASMKVASDYYFGDNHIWDDFYRRNPDLVRDRPPFDPGIFAAKVEQAINAHLAFEPTFHRTPTGEGKGHEKKTGPLERGLQALVNDIYANSPNYPTKENGKQIVLFNYTQRGVLVDMSALQRPKQKEGQDKEDFEREEWEWMATKQHWNPIRYVVPNPGEVLMEPMEVSPGVAIWRRKMKAFQLAEHTRVRRERLENDRPGRFKGSFVAVYDFGAKEPYDDIEIEEWWTPRWVGLREKGGRILSMERNLMGIQPFLGVWGGNAISRAGVEFNLKWWVEQAIMFKAMPTLTMYAQAKVGRHDILMRTANAPYVFAGDAAEGAAQLRNRILSGEAKDWGILNVPQLASQAYQEEADLLASIDAITFSPLTAGLRDITSETATGVSIRAENASRMFKAMVRKLAHLESNAGSNVMKLVYKMAEEYGDDYQEIGIGEDRLRVKDMEKQFHIQASFEQTDVASRMQELQEGKILYDMNLVGDEHIYRIVRIEDAEGARQDARESLAMRNPLVQEQFLIDAWRKNGLTQLADKMQAQLDIAIAQRMTQGGGPGQGQVAGAPVAPMGPGPMNGQNPRGV